MQRRALRRALAFVTGHGDGDRALVPPVVHIGGAGRSELLRSLRERGVRLNEAAETLFEDPRFATLGGRSVVEIAAVSVADLGFADGATYEALVARATERGWFECPLETGPHLRLQLPDQPDASEGMPPTKGCAPPGGITVASRPLDETDATPKGFYLRRYDGASWLRGYRSGPDHVWRARDVLVFSRTRPEA